jgi:hypothetical protein
MALKEEVMELLRQGREEALAELAASNRRALRPLMGRLWDPDVKIRRRAAAAIGCAATSHDDLGVEIIRRLLWALNDESATNGVFGIPALGEIGRRSPAMLSPYLPALVAMAWDDGLRPELLRALLAVAGADPRRVAPHLDELTRRVDSERPEEMDLLRRLHEAVGQGRADDE